MAKCGMKCEVYSRVTGYLRPVSNWNSGKKEEFRERVEFDEEVSLKNEKVQMVPNIVVVNKKVFKNGSSANTCSSCVE